MRRRECCLFVLLVLWLPLACFAAEEPVAPIRVAVYTGEGTSRSVKNLLEVVKASDRFRVTELSADEIRAGALTGYDVVLHPGGSGSGQARGLKAEGCEAVRAFVKQGGGYVGFCAGAYLATNDYSWSLGILDAKVVDKQHWARGYGEVTLSVTPAGKELLGLPEDKVAIYYHQGPLLAPNEDPQTPDYEELASFATEIAKKGAPKGVMSGTTAVCRGQFGDGRVFCFSPHPEKTAGLEDVVHRAIVWSAGGNRATATQERAAATATEPKAGER